MPRVTQYIRDEDFEAWKAIPNKSEFIHKALGGGWRPATEQTLRQYRFTGNERYNNQAFDKENIKEPELKPRVKTVVELATSKDGKRVVVVGEFKPCKHGVDPNLCKFAKPGKPCK